MTQFAILQALSLTGEKLQGDLAELLALDSTTLTRSVGILRKRGLIKARKGHDRRERWLSLSRSGRQNSLAFNQPGERSRNRCAQHSAENAGATWFGYPPKLLTCRSHWQKESIMTSSNFNGLEK